MAANFNLGDFEIFWLAGGAFDLAGDTMFTVPKTQWSKKYPGRSGNNAEQDDDSISLLTSPLLIKTPNATVLVETGLGNYLTDSQRQVFQNLEEWDMPGELKKLGLGLPQVDYVVLSHCDFKHAGGIAMLKAKKLVVTCPKATHIIQKSEWEALQQYEQSGAAGSSLPKIFAKLLASGKLHLADGDYQVCQGVDIVHTGGHTRGHQVVRLESKGQVAYYLADLLPTHIHYNPLWIMPADNFPLKTAAVKKEFENRALKEDAWFLFYHDPFMHACKFDRKGNIKQEWHQPRLPAPATKKRWPTQALHVTNDNKVVISCPQCVTTRFISVAKHMGRQHSLMVKCPCGASFGLEIDFRKNYRKMVSIGAFFSTLNRDIGYSEIGDLSSVPVNCNIKNISRGGLGFVPLSRVNFKVGDRLKVIFTLDKKPPEIIKSEIIVRTVEKKYIGCEFADTLGQNERKIGFYLMK